MKKILLILLGLLICSYLSGVIYYFYTSKEFELGTMGFGMKTISEYVVDCGFSPGIECDGKGNGIVQRYGFFGIWIPQEKGDIFQR